MDVDELRRWQSLLQEVSEHRDTIATLEKTLKHARDIADAERRARQRAEDSAKRAWSIAARG